MKYRILYTVTTLLFLLAFTHVMYSQTAPGGIGNASGSNGQPELKLWLLPDSLDETDGQEIDTWTDFSGNNNNLTGTGSNGNPLFRKNFINGHAGVQFQNDLSRFVVQPFSMPSDAVSLFFVLRTDATTQEPNPFSYAISGQDNEYMMLGNYPSSGDLLNFINGDRYDATSDFVDGQWTVFSHQWRSSDGRFLVHDNGTETVNATHATGASLSSGGALVIGAEQNSLRGGYKSAQDFEDGEIAELIMYGSSLKQAQRVVIEDYLAQKYSLDGKLTTDHYQPADASYTVAMTGMGKESDGAIEASAEGIHLSENGGLDNGEYLMTAHDGATNTEATINTSAEVTNAGVDSAWNRSWYLDKTGNFNAKIAFDFGEGIDGKNPGELQYYELLYRSSLTSDYSTVTVAGKGVQNGDQIYFAVDDANLADGYYTLGSADADKSPLTGTEGQTWYTLISGEWDKSETWTLDPSGALPDNPNQETPKASDDVVILTGKTVTVKQDDVAASELTVEGRLDFQDHTGQSFTTIKGGGRILLSADEFPSGADASHFYTEGEGEGTVVYYGNSYNLDQSLECYNLEINLNNTTDKLTLLENYTVNGNMIVNQGQFQINDGSTTTNLTMEVREDFTIKTDGSVLTGSANARHQLNLYGNFTNNGIAEFTNRTSADYNNEANDGIVDVNFLSDNANQRIDCNGTTNFYRIEIDKGNDATYQLAINASDPSHFNLYGYAADDGQVAQLTEHKNALGLVKGTVRLKENVNIPVLTSSNATNYPISESARLWIDGGSAAKNGGNAITTYGQVKVTSGTLEAKVPSGITIRDNGSVNIKGGTVNINQFRTSVGGADDVGAYIQSGGTVNVLGASEGGSIYSDFYAFTLTHPGNVFNMSGGTLHIHDDAQKGGLFINSDEVNQNVTGGTVIFEIEDNENFRITSKAPFWNVIIRNSQDPGGKHILTNGSDVGPDDENLAVQDLHVLNDLTIETGTKRSETAGGVSNTYGSYLDLVPDNATPADLYVGGDLTIEDSGVLDVWGWTGSDNNTSATLYFNGSSEAVFHIGNITSYSNALLEYKSPNVSDGGPDGNFPSSGVGEMHTWKYNLPLYNLIVDKPDGKLSLAANSPGKGGSWGDAAGQAGNWVCSNGGKNTRRWLSQLLSIKNQFKLLNGTFSQMDPYNNVTITEGGGGTYGSVGDPVGYSVNFYTTDVEIRDTMFVYQGGTTPKEGIIEIRAPNPLTLQTTDNAYIGNMRFLDDHDNPVTLVSDVHFGRIEYFNGTIDIGKHNLKVDLFETYAVDHNLRMDNVSSGQPVFGVPNFIRMDGNASDGGFSLKVPKQPTWPLPNNDEFEYLLDQYADKQGPYAFPDRLWFPIGTDASGSDKYTPAVCRLHDYGTIDGDEYITVRVVDKELQTTDLAGGDVLSYYWNVDFEGYAAGEEPTVSWIFQYDDSDLDIGAGDETAYVPGKVLDGGNYTRSDEGGTAAVKDGGATDIEENILGSDPANIVIFNGVGTSSSPVSDDNIESISSTMFDTDASGPNINSNWQNAWPNTGFTLENANYTAGEANRFVGSPEVYYTKHLGDAAQTNWEDGTLWTFAPNDIDGNGQVDSYELHDSRQPNAGDYPQEGDIAVVGWVPFGDPNYADGEPHGVEVDNSVNFAELRFNQMLDANNGNPTSRVYAYNFQFRPTVCVNPGGSLDGNIIAGEGMFWCRSTGGNQVDTDFSNNDIGEFVEQDSSYFAYESTDDAFVYNNIPSEVPNLLISGNGWGDNDRDFEISNDINIKTNFDLLGDINLVLSSGANGDITVGNNLKIYQNDANGNNSGGYGEIAFPNDASRTINILGDLKLINEQAEIHIRNPNNPVNKSNLKVHGNILQDNNTGGGLQLFSALNEDYVELALKGKGDHTYSVYSGAIAGLHSLIMDKGTDTTSSFTFEDNFTLHGPTSGAGVDKAIELQNGRLILNDPNINVDLTTGDDDFYIPGTAGLEVRQGTANASGNSGILLDGKLQVSGGTVDMSGRNNYIEYSASGDAEIDVSAGSLTVGSQIRRGLTSTEGILTYNQSGGTVTVGTDAAPENNRGVFEILNTGSAFNHTGGDLIIARAQDNPTSASFYFDPEIATFGEDTKIQFGNASTPADDVMGIYSTQAIPNILVDSTNTPTLQQWTVPLAITDSLEILSGATYDANGRNLTLEGDLIANGTYTPNGNTTYFRGSSPQQIVGSPAFWNLTKDQGNSLTLNNDITVNNKLELTGGTFSDNSQTLHAKGNVLMGASHTHGGSGDGIAFDGSELQELQTDDGSATFGKLTINNPGGTDSVAVAIPAGHEIHVSNALEMRKGILDIGKNLLVIEESAEIIEGNAFSSNNMIQTNISFTDAGIKKYFPAISSSTEFTYPIGSAGKYTPVTFDITNKDAGGFIRVKAADEIHPTIINDSEPCNELADTANVLKYHWLLDAENISGFDATAQMHYYQEDYQLESTDYTVTDYITARLLLGSTQWNKYDPSTFDETNQMLSFTFNDTDDAGIRGDYTAGVEDYGGTCEGAIPDEVPTYITTSSGDWTDAGIWDTYPVSGGTVPGGGPKGASVIIEHEITMPRNYISSYKTTIDTAGVDTTGILKVNETFGHRLGIVDGKGTLQIKRGALPAGVYEEFFGPDGGTIEFAGTNKNYDVLSEVTEVNNLRFTGDGDRRLPNLDIELYGNMEIAGANESLAVINEHSRTLKLDSNLVRSKGSFDAGSGSNARLQFQGDKPQHVYGDFTGTNDAVWNNFTLNTTSSVSLHGTVEASGSNIDFTNGYIKTTASEILRLTNTNDNIAVNYSDASFVDGPLQKKINDGGNFEFPVGDGDRLGELIVSSGNTSGSDQFWEAEYYNRNPSVDGYDPNSFADPLKYVSKNEYWRLSGPTGGPTADDKASVTIRWDEQSGISGNYDKLRIAQWKSTQWEAVGEDVTGDTPGSGTIKTTNDITNLGDGIFTIATTYLSRKEWVGGVSGDETTWAETNNWTPSGIPDFATTITIPNTASYDVTITSNAKTDTTTIESNRTVTIKPGGSMEIDGELIHEGDIVLASDASGTGYLKPNGTISGNGNVTIQQFLEGMEYHYITPPLNNVDTTIYTVTSWGDINPNFYTFNEDISSPDWLDGWEMVNKSSHSADLNVGLGYIVYRKQDVTYTMSGTFSNLNKNTITEPVNYNDHSVPANGWNIVGNPYTCPIDADAFIDENAINNTRITGSLYFWDDDGSDGSDYTSDDYATYNEVGSVEAGGGGTAPNGYVDIGQSFMVKARNTGSTDVTFNETMRSTQSAVFFKSGTKANTVSEEETIQKIRIRLKNSRDQFNETLLAFTESATEDYDVAMDGEKLKGNPDIAFYSMLRDEEYAIQAYPQLSSYNNTAVRIPLGYDTGIKGSHTIWLEGLENIGDTTEIQLLDKKQETFHNLRKGEYEFKSEGGLYHDRFEILVNPGLDNNVNDILENKDVKIYSWKNTVHIVCAEHGGNAVIYNLKGRQMKEVRWLNAGKNTITIPKTGIYVVKVNTTNGVATKKVWIAN